MLIDYKFLIPLLYYLTIAYFIVIILNSFYSEVIKKKNLIIKYEKDLLRISFNYFNIIMHNLRRCIICITLIISIYLTLKNRSYFIFTFISSLFFLRDFYPLIKCKKNKGVFLNVPYRSIKTLEIGISVNDELLQYGQDKSISIDIKQMPTSRSIYYGFYITSIYNTVEFIKPVPSYQYKEIENKLVDFLTENGFNVTINMIKK